MPHTHPTVGETILARMLRGERGLAPALAFALAWPVSVGFGLVVAARNALYSRRAPGFVPQRASIPVISVGNLSVGGTGKSLLAVALAVEALALGLAPAILARGHGGAIGDGLGDEATEQDQTLGGTVPIYCSANRLASAKAAVAAGARLAILDDGFQHRRMARDADIVLVDALDPSGNRRLLPAGLLREPLLALARADLVVLTRAELAGDQACAALTARIRAAGYEGPIAHGRHRPRDLTMPGETVAMEPISSLNGRSVLLASGIGNPAGFAATVASLGAKIHEHIARPDHHRWAPSDLKLVRSMLAQAPSETLVLTTGKDGVKIAPLDPGTRWRVLRVEFEMVDQPEALRNLLSRAVRESSGSQSSS